MVLTEKQTAVQRHKVKLVLNWWCIHSYSQTVWVFFSELFSKRHWQNHQNRAPPSGRRWQEEISFRHLKYSADLSAVHARKRSSILQEIWARAILYNFSFVIIRELAKRRAKKKRKYEYVINKTKAIHLIRDLLMKRKGGSSPPDLEGLISNEILPLRPGRSDPRKVRAQSVIPFNYRFS